VKVKIVYFTFPMATYFNKRSKIFLLQSLILLVLAIGITYIFKSEKNFESKISKFERVLHVKEKNITSLLQDMSEKNLTDSIGINTFLGNESLIMSCQKQAFIVAVYNNDSLIFWSDNILPLMNYYDSYLYTEGAKHFNNGWYQLVKLETEEFVYLGFITIKNDYKYQNDFLVNEFQKDFKLNKEVEISELKSKYNVTDSEDTFLFSLNPPGNLMKDEKKILWLFVLYVLGFLFFIGFMFNFYKNFPIFKYRPNLFLLVFAVDLVIIRFLIFYFKIPHILYQSKIFSPVYYATSDFLPSIGDLLINTLILISFAYAFFVHFRIGAFGTWKKPIKIALAVILISSVIMLYQVLVSILRGLIFNSNVSFNLNNILTLSPLSIIAFLIISLLVIIYLLLAIRLLDLVFQLVPVLRNFLLTGLLTFATVFVLSLSYRFCNPVNLLVLFIFVISYWFFRKKTAVLLNVSSAAFYILLFSFLATYSLHHFKNEKEKEKRKLLAIKLSTERDQIAEFKFKEISQKINSDSLLRNIIEKIPFDPNAETNAINFITNTYFRGYWLKYNIQITVCNPSRELNVMPGNYIINCNEYFKNIISDFGDLTICDNLFYLDYGSGNNNYLAVFDLLENDTIHKEEYVIYLELVPKDVLKGLGYPELLINKGMKSKTDIYGYSYAFYTNGELLRHVGKYFYSINLANYGKLNNSFMFFENDGHHHLYYRISNESSLIISKKKADYLELIAPFSYLFVFIALSAFIFLCLIYFPVNLRKLYLNFRNRLQISMISIILISFLFVGVMTLYYIIWLNNNKNRDILSEKTHSVLIELEHKLADEEKLTPEITDYLSGLLIKFSQVFFSDINVYDLNGRLIASSRPQIFEEGLIATNMNALAFDNLAYNKKSLFIQDESIGNYHYLSAYVPFRNNQNKLIAYLNLPYFAKQDELKNEISTFLVAFVNIYVILIAFAIFITLLVSNYITRPLKLIMANISNVQLDKPNEKIQWERKDEIGNLITEYNRMVDELRQSAELLAKSERESAWREMAKQVAHEIKNPLTPMKLSVQYLQKAWDEKTEDWEERLNRFTKTIVEQIDSLSAIASEFSDFAKMPKAQSEKMDISTIIDDTIELFKDVQNVHITFFKEAQIPYYVFADKKQILRVFNNLIKNSIQAIHGSEHGIIEIHVKEINAYYLLSVKDNGYGISEEQSEKIFYPNFTTKTGGMGLGLAIVKSIVLSTGGEIWFESEKGNGATFYIKLPVYQEEE